MLCRALLQRETRDRSEAWLASVTAGSDDFLQRLSLQRKLRAHTGCVNTLSFNSLGDILTSGSDDGYIILHDWQRGVPKLRFHSGHTRNVFQAKIVPGSNDKTLLSCGADGQVRVFYVRESGAVDQHSAGRHHGSAQKLALQPGCPPCFLSCGEDGRVLMYDLRQSDEHASCALLVKPGTGVAPHPVSLNCVAFNPSRPWLFAAAGRDTFTRVYDVRHLGAESAAHTGSPFPVTITPKPVHRLAPAGLAGSVVNDGRLSRPPRHITCVAYNERGEMLASYSEEDIYLFDAAACGCARSTPLANSGDHVERSAGTERRASGSPPPAGCLRQPDGDAGDHVLQRYSGHRNYQTIKEVAFFGERGQHVLSGSDCGHIYVWRRGDGQLVAMRRGDEQVVNCLESHPWQIGTLATSGIESDIKIWAPTADQALGLDDVARQLVERNRSWVERAETRITPTQLLALLNRATAQRRRRPADAPSEPIRRGRAAGSGGEDAAAAGASRRRTVPGTQDAPVAAGDRAETTSNALADWMDEGADDDGSDDDDGSEVNSDRPPRCYVN